MPEAIWIARLFDLLQTYDREDENAEPTIDDTQYCLDQLRLIGESPK